MENNKTKFIGPLLVTDNLRTAVSEEEIKTAAGFYGFYNGGFVPEFVFVYEKIVETTARVIDDEPKLLTDGGKE
jgi:hypothetical protein